MQDLFTLILFYTTRVKLILGLLSHFAVRILVILSFFTFEDNYRYNNSTLGDNLTLRPRVECDFVDSADLIQLPTFECAPELD